MTYGNPDPTALYILREILQGPVTAQHLMARYAISNEILQRYLEELGHIGVVLKAADSGGEQQLRCLNVEEVKASAILGNWLAAEDRRHEDPAGEAVENRA